MIDAIFREFERMKKTVSHLYKRTAFPRTEPLKAKDRNARGQGHRRKCSPKKKRSFKNFFQAISIHWRTQNF